MHEMLDRQFTRFAFAAFGMAAWLLVGCGHGHYHREPDSVVLLDDQGFRHEGYYDEEHHWHGGYYDQRHEFHADARDWHGGHAEARHVEGGHGEADHRGGDNHEHEQR